MSSSVAPWAVALLAFAAAGLTIVAGSALWDWWSERRRRRLLLDRVASEEESSAEDPGLDLLRTASEEDPGLVDLLMSRLPGSRDLEQLLEQAHLAWSPLRFWIVTLASAGAFFFVTWLVVRIPLVAAIPALFGATVPYLHVQRKKRKWLEEFEAVFPEAIDQLTRAIRAGHALSNGLRMVADDMSEPLSGEFRRVFEEQKFGLPLEESLLDLARRVDLMDVRIFVTAILIQREVGGNLAEILDKIAHTIRERFTIQRQVRVYTAQGRFTGYILAALPLAVGFVIFALNPEYMRVLWVAPVGRLMIVVALLLQMAGYVTIRRIVDIEF